jgi:hypothetical protein
MATSGPSENYVRAPLRVYLVLARGYSTSITVVTAADPEGAMRAFVKSRDAHASLQPTAEVASGRSACLLAEINPSLMPDTSDKPGAWLAAVAHSDGVIALFQEGVP